MFWRLCLEVFASCFLMSFSRGWLVGAGAGAADYVTLFRDILNNLKGCPSFLYCWKGQPRPLNLKPNPKQKATTTQRPWLKSSDAFTAYPSLQLILLARINREPCPLSPLHLQSITVVTKRERERESEKRSPRKEHNTRERIKYPISPKRKIIVMTQHFKYPTNAIISPSLMLLVALLFLASLVDASTISMMNPVKWILHAKGLSLSKNHHQQQQQQLWMYSGSLYDPLDGRKVANVQGLELLKKVCNNESSSLQITPLLQNPNATYEDAATILSQKVFCYTTPSTASSGSSTQPQEQQILRNIRVRPQSPLKLIPLDQAVSVFETATTYTTRNSGSGGDEDGDDGQELIIHSEWPSNRQTIWSKATNIKMTDTSLDYTLFAKRRSSSSLLYRPDLVTTKTKTAATDDAVAASPKRSSLIQIGPSNNIESKHKFGARETYSWTRTTNLSKLGSENGGGFLSRFNPFRRQEKSLTGGVGGSDDTTTHLTYSRYGEAPSFYAPGRMCMLELQGRPISCLKDATPILQNLIEHNIDGWDVGSDCSTRPLRLKPEPISNLPYMERQKLKLEQIWSRVQAATSVKHQDSYNSVIPR